MNDFQGLLSSDYGFKPQGKAAPMAGAKSGINSSSSSSSNSAFNFEIGGSKTASFPSNSKNSSSLFDDHDTLFRPNKKNTSSDDFGILDDVFAGGGMKNNSSKSTSVNLDSIFGGGGGGGGGSDSGSKFSSLPVFDKPVYDDEDSSSAKFENIFAPASSASAKKSDGFDDLLGGLGKKEPLSSRSVGSGSKGADKGYSGFDDLLPGFGGGSSSSTSRISSDANKRTSSLVDDPFVVLESTSPPVSSSGIFADPLDEIGNLNNAGQKAAEKSSSGSAFDDIDPLGGFGKAVPPYSAEINGEEEAFQAKAPGRQTSVSGDATQKPSVRSSERGSEKKVSMEDYPEPSIFDMPSVSAETRAAPSASSPAHSNSSFRESNSHGHVSPNSEENMGSSDDIWLTVSEVPLFTHPTAAPPPSRPPPPRPARFSRGEFGSFPSSNVHKKVNDHPSYPGSVPNFQSPKSAPSGASGSFASPLDELEEFAMGRNVSDVGETHASSDVQSGEDFDSNSVAAASAAAMKEAMDRAEAKFRYARGVRERENSKVSKNRESVQAEKEENPMYDAPEREFREYQERHERERQQKREEEERRRVEEEERRRVEKEWEEKEREKRRIDKEREFGRQAVERAAKEARERAAVEARTRAERVAVQRAQAEARERAEKYAVQRAQAEARERAAAEAKERAEKAAADAREKAKAEVKEKEAREREAKEKEARERASSAARASQTKNENDLESFFSMGRASSAPRPRAASSDPFETQFQAKPAPEATRASVNSSNMRKASSSTNIVDDLSSIFGGPPSSGDFQEVDGETEDRRKARMDRHHRTQERAAKALAEKNARDLEVQREQAERNRISETLDVEIKRWAAGKEGNLRALLSTMQYVLWPECGWQPVSLTDLITGAAVKKAYRKATLCIHPDKVQQKGATLQQKFVAEKVFDLLKEAWNKFNSEELF